MSEPNDHELLAEFTRNESEAAFATLVARYVNLVYSTALRFTGNAHQAEEVTQAVFIILARKAGKLRRGTVLSGWLYQTARLTAGNFVKGERRRQRREQEAYMQSTLTEPEAAAWEQIVPLLDEAMGRLGKTDRDAVVLRFFENKTVREVGVTLELTEAAAYKRVQRALEKLRRIFSRRGITFSTTLLAGAVSAKSVLAAPPGLVTTVVATTKGATVSATIATLVKGTMKTMTWMKLKFAVGVAATAILVGGGVIVTIAGNESQAVSTAKSNSNRQAQIMITALFVKTPTANVDAIVKGFSGPNIPIDPGSEEFQDLLKRHAGVSILGCPRAVTGSSNEVEMSMTRQVSIQGTNSDVGIRLNTTPVIQGDSKIDLKLRAELLELVAGTAPSIRVTKIEQQHVPLIIGNTIMIRGKIGGEGVTTVQTQDGPPETLLVFISPALVDERGNKIIGR